MVYTVLVYIHNKSCIRPTVSLIFLEIDDISSIWIVIYGVEFSIHQFFVVDNHIQKKKICRMHGGNLELLGITCTGNFSSILKVVFTIPASLIPQQHIFYNTDSSTSISYF